MTDHFNQLKEEETERLALLIEECGEVIHAAGKVLRHGYNSSYPINGVETTNKEYLGNEAADLTYIIALMIEKGDLSAENVEKALEDKPKRLAKYLHHTEAV